jgi:hypothetical protein
MCNFHFNAQLSKASLDVTAEHLVFKALAPIKKGAQVYSFPTNKIISTPRCT